MTPIRLVVATLCGALALVHLAAPCAAQSPAVQAEALFRQGKELMAKQKYAEACAAFDGSQQLEPSISTLLNQASCREKNLQLTTAWGLFVEAERQTRNLKDASNVQLHKVAATRAAALEPRLPKLTINVGDRARIAGLQVTRDGKPVDQMLWNRTLPLDGGSYTIAAVAPQRKEWSITITLASENERKTVDVPTLEVAPTVTPVVVAPVAPSTPAEPAPAPIARARSKTVPIIVGVAGLALIGGAIGLEVSARGTYDDATLEADDGRQESLWKSANRKRYAAQGFAVAGLGCVGVAVWLLVRSSGAETTPTTAGLQPVISGDQVGLSFSGRY